MATNSDDGGGYEKYRKSKMESGLFFQDFVVDTLFNLMSFPIVQYTSREYQITVGESRQGVEIKHDENYVKTGNLYIEVGEKARPRAGDYFPSGIYRDDNSWLYVIGDFNTIFVYGVRLLRMLAGKPGYSIIEIGTKTSKGFLLRGQDTEKYALAVVRPNAEEKIMKFKQGFKESLRDTKLLLALLKSDARQGTLFSGEEEDKEDKSGEAAA